MKTYILQFKYKEGNGWAIINAHSPNQAEQVFYTQTKFDNPSMVSMQESNYYGEEMQLVYEGSISTLNANLYSLAVLDGFEGSLDDFIQSQRGDKGDTGDTGPQGVGIAKVEQTTTSHESSGENVITVTLTNGNNYTFSVFNGEKGADGSGGGGTEQIQSDWAQSDNTKKDYIKNKPSLATVATSGNYNDLSNKPAIPDAQIQSDWNQSTATAKDYIKNKPTIPAAQVQSNWNESDTNSKAYIQNKPSIPTVPTNVSAFTNDANYVTSTDLANKANKRTVVNTSTLAADTYNELGTTDSPAPTLPASYTAADEFIFTFVCQSDSCDPQLPSGVVLADGFDFSEVATGVKFQVSICDGIAAYLCVTPSS